jgi:hypothetical protein
MTLTIDLPIETQKRLLEKASVKGLTVKSYLENLVQSDIDAASNGSHSRTLSTDLRSTDDWIAAFRAWTSSHKRLAHEADDSRESIYAGRGE